MPHALLNRDGSIKSLFARHQPGMDGLVKIENGDPRVADFKHVGRLHALERSANRACLALHASIMGDQLDAAMKRAIAAGTKNADPDDRQRAQMAVEFEVDIAFARAVFREHVANTFLHYVPDDVSAALAHLQATLDAIADAYGVARVVVGDSR